MPKFHEGGRSPIASKKTTRDKKAQVSCVDASCFGAFHLCHIPVPLFSSNFLAKFSQFYFQNG